MQLNDYQLHEELKEHINEESYYREKWLKRFEFFILRCSSFVKKVHKSISKKPFPFIYLRKS